MTDTSTQPTTDADQPTEQQTHQRDGAQTAAKSNAISGFDPRSNEIHRYLAWGALAVCSLVAVLALFQFYGSVTSTIELWVDPKFQPPIRAAFNLAVLLTSLIGISLLVRELK
ncbi:hypothetical protein E2L06_13275 [Haloterrigena sp. H1]|uniref:hypothetical protein n=1 Tax=Haloterrigena sp. H1 TaxID=2552943 RepID=UPI00110D33A6|nr:hypothetical protein [Haloterrigena sp. H1]TMT87499.1 hypothetical protein E2L06_13275 [Haloterrigena sp. H1]